MNTMNIIDLHCDTLIKLHEQGCGLEDVQGHIDLDALRRGGALVQCFAVYTPTHEQVHKHKITTGPWEYFNTAADIFDREMEKHKELIRPVRCAADIKENMDAGYPRCSRWRTAYVSTAEWSACSSSTTAACA